MCSPQSLQLLGKLQRVLMVGSRNPRCWREGKMVRGPGLCHPSSSKNSIPSQLNNANFILLVRFPGLGRGINLETPGHGWFGSVFWLLKWALWAWGRSSPKSTQEGSKRLPLERSTVPCLQGLKGGDSRNWKARW